MYRHVRQLLVSPKFVIGNGLVAGVVGIVLALFIPNAYTMVIPPFLAVGALLGVGVYNRNPGFDHRELTRELLSGVVRQRALLALHVLLAAGIVTQYALADFRRGLVVQVALVALWLVALLSILALDSVRTRFVVLFGTGLLHRGLVYYASATQIGIDALFHNRAAEAIAATNSLAPLALSKYWYAPVYHLLVATGSWGFGVSGRDAAFVLVTAITTVAVPVVIYYYLAGIWSETVGLVGVFLYLVGDSAILATVHTIPTTLGLAFFAGAMFFGEGYLDRGERRYLGAYLAVIVGLFFTHQLSMFVSVVVVTAYVGMVVFWRGQVTRRELLLTGSLIAAFLLQASYTQYSGPEGETGSFLSTVGGGMVNSFIRAFTTGGRTANYPPAGANVAVSGADAVSPVHVVGMGILFALAVVGTVYWITSRESTRRVAVSLGTVVVTTGVIIFGAPALGLEVFIPGRWFPFVYVILGVLAAPGVAAILLSGRNYVSRPQALVILLVVVAAPYAVFMTMNSQGAIDNPVFDDAPGATRLSTTASEAAAYEHVDAYGTGATVVADHAAYRMIQRNYEHPAEIYDTQYRESGTEYSGELLIVYREYAQTDHGSYELKYQGETFRVFGPLPGPQWSDSIVYDDGAVRLAHRIEPAPEG